MIYFRLKLWKIKKAFAQKALEENWLCFSITILIRRACRLSKVDGKLKAVKYES